MNEQERELDFMVAEITDALKQERERTQRLTIEVQLLTEALRAKSEWVGLTDEQRNDCLVEADPCECLATPEAQQLMIEVEAKLKENNG